MLANSITADTVEIVLVVSAMCKNIKWRCMISQPSNYLFTAENEEPIYKFIK